MALFDYDPPTMSPNPEACDEELPFREGQLIKVCIFTKKSAKSYEKLANQNLSNTVLILDALYVLFLNLD